ncbi:class F sortase [Rhizomonospora bruguierae]|uniref:class F sortase n=1 Tax=Rhizomonospora bruguierae TaxID=1581705 RepID=UPI001BCEA22C|nr:class F sortase [Micromonospora sp. NBRC 107566]
MAAGPRRPLALLLVLAGAVAVCAGLVQATGLTWPHLSGGGDPPPPRAFPVLEPSRPVKLSIPSIGVSAPVFGVGLAGDGTIAVPPVHRHHEVGWYVKGPTPGQFGPAIIVGHADTRSGPSIFYRLPKLRPGAKVEVTRRDRSIAVFQVTSVEHFDKAKLPAERVYDDYSRPGLRLITCGGQWKGGGIGYADNIVVFATLVDAREP